MNVVRGVPLSVKAVGGYTFALECTPWASIWAVRPSDRHLRGRLDGNPKSVWTRPIFEENVMDDYEKARRWEVAKAVVDKQADSQQPHP